MSIKYRKVLKAFSLIELMVAVTVISIAAVGGLEYQYYAVKHSRLARTQITVSRAAQLLVEDWKSVGGSTSYNPLNLQLGFANTGVPGGFAMGIAVGTVLNNTVYTITVNNVPMVIMLGYTDISHDAISDTTLRQLIVMVRWQQGQATGAGGTTLCDSPYILTTYVRLNG
jgi:prepilin-type N-terminal cleavage/methylation domain-containing protein